MKEIPIFFKVGMRKDAQLFSKFIFVVIFLTLFLSSAHANNLNISNVTLADRNPSANTVAVQFDASWENSWKSKINHDAVWLTFRLDSPSVSPLVKNLCQITASGLSPLGTSAGSNTNLEIYVPADKRGAFLRPSAFGSNASMSTTSAKVILDYSGCGFSDNDTVHVSVFGLEMIYVPQGAFYAGDYDTSTAALDEGSADSDSWYIASEAAISVSNPASNGYRYVSGGQGGENATGSTFTIPADFPKGYKAFYAMKYEITEGQWAEFLDSIPSADRLNRDLTDNLHKTADTVKYRNTISCSGSPLICSTQRPARAVNYLTWMDLSAFLDWAALRPMTELEFEKISRGPVLASPGEYAWGSTDIAAAATISGANENGAEAVSTTNANAHYNNTTLTGGDTSSGADYAQGPLRVGIFATSSSTRVTAGAGYYGAMDLSGNLSERTVTIGNAGGRSFVGTHGDGVLSSVPGFEGNATESDWPGIDGVAARGVTGAAGAGLRGGGWNEASTKLRVSNRADAADASTTALSNSGGRGVRTYDGN